MELATNAEQVCRILLAAIAIVFGLCLVAYGLYVRKYGKEDSHDG